MGLAIASEAARRGARVTLVLGPTALTPPTGSDVVRVRGAAEMHAAVTSRAVEADAVIMAAAVADYAPAGGADPVKVEKEDGPRTLTLVRTPDILADLGRWRGDRTRPVLVGFAAQTGDPVPRARQKLQAKGVDFIVANDVSKPGSGFDTDTNEATLVGRDTQEALPLMPKTRLAGVILDRVESLLAARGVPTRI
jgi:phosphopantothenoylcysteine decarboxylase/phosphopantothenate--cysteine ligase